MSRLNGLNTGSLSPTTARAAVSGRSTANKENDMHSETSTNIAHAGQPLRDDLGKPRGPSSLQPWQPNRVRRGCLFF